VSATQSLYPPGPTNARRVLLDIERNSLQFLLNVHKDYGGLVHYMHGPAHVYSVSDPVLIHQVLVEQYDKMARAPIAHNHLSKFLGQGLLLSSGARHRTQRRLLQPLFTPSVVSRYASTILDCTHQLMATWKNGEVRDITQDMINLTMDIVYRAIFGSYATASSAEVRGAITTMQQYMGEALRHTPKITEQECQNAVSVLDKAISEMIVQRRSSTGDDLLSLLMNAQDPETGQAMDPQQIHDEALTFFVAGQESSAVALTWLWYLLAEHPKAEDRTLGELVRKLQSREVTSDDVQGLPYVEQCIKEALRLYPPAWLIGRTPTESVQIGGYTIQPGDHIAISPWVIHRNPQTFADPEQFIPERFSTDPPKYTYLPFGAGPHVCIGQPFAVLEMLLIVATILRQYHFELVQEQVIQPEPLLTLRPKFGVQMKIVRR
jgi:cytochrome P450